MCQFQSPDGMPAGSLSRFTGTSTWNQAIINVISYTCAFPITNLPSLNVRCRSNDLTEHSKVIYYRTLFLQKKKVANFFCNNKQRAG